MWIGAEVGGSMNYEEEQMSCLFGGLARLFSLEDFSTLTVLEVSRIKKKSRAPKRDSEILQNSIIFKHLPVYSRTVERIVDFSNSKTKNVMWPG